MISDYLSNIKALILDMDGVLWCDTQPLGKLSAIFDQIRDFGYTNLYSLRTMPQEPWMSILTNLRGLVFR